jgi:hypothetical protein
MRSPSPAPAERAASVPRTPTALELTGAGSAVMLAGLGGYMALSGERL